MSGRNGGFLACTNDRHSLLSRMETGFGRVGTGKPTQLSTISVRKRTKGQRCIRHPTTDAEGINRSSAGHLQASKKAARRENPHEQGKKPGCASGSHRVIHRFCAEPGGDDCLFFRQDDDPNDRSSLVKKHSPLFRQTAENPHDKPVFGC